MLIELMVIAMTSGKTLKILKERTVNTPTTSDPLKSELKKKRTLISVSKKTLKIKITPTNK